MATANISLSNFKANVRELASPNRFLVTFFGLSEDATGMTLPGNYQYFVRSVGLPTKTIPDISNLYWFGLNYKIGGDPTFETITLKFLNTYDFALRQKFEQWMDKISHTIENTRGEPGDYKASMVLSQINNENEVSASYFCEGVYPTSVSTIEFSQETNSTIEEFDVIFNIDYFSDGQGDGSVGTVRSSSSIPSSSSL